MKTILVVDDEPDIIKVLQLRLENKGYKVISASDGKEGLKIAKEHVPDLIIMDLMMPVMDGNKACAFMKADKRLRSKPIIILTASAEDSDRFISRQMGADAFCNKPLNMEGLLKQIEQLLPSV
jgi:CheY-like chemotaxis protein